MSLGFVFCFLTLSPSVPLSFTPSATRHAPCGLLQAYDLSSHFRIPTLPRLSSSKAAFASPSHLPTFSTSALHAMRHALCSKQMTFLPTSAFRLCLACRSTGSGPEQVEGSLPKAAFASPSHLPTFSTSALHPCAMRSALSI
ncbi:hypothetical protein D1AOALGA4SA_9562 [Olavius algarvensis Delta 1 endosymbiont]|nr:hypothetical protein D1AOALGA4SA_9562 [Olavius algarvensis Delta 1 endosymbiont]